MDRRLVVVGTLLLVAGAGSFAGVMLSAPAPVQDVSCDGCNVVLISIDTLRADHLGVYGYERDTSPFIDTFAANATVFTNAFAQSSHTLASHFSLFTGMFPRNHGVTLTAPLDRGFSENMTLLAEVLQDSGYRTFSYNGGVNVRGELGFARGFDNYVSNHTQESFAPNGSFAAAYEDIAERVQNGSAPFFLFYHTYKVHDPYYPPLQAANQFSGFNATIREKMHTTRTTYLRNRSLDRPEFAYRWDYLAPRLANRSDWRDHAVAAYDAEIRYTDAFIGRLLDLLDETGVRNETVVVIVSDHGEQFGDHGGWFHWELYRELLHVPLIIDVPGHPGGTIDTVTGLVDLPLTLLDILSVPPGQIRTQSDGVSVLPLFQGESVDRRYIRASHFTGQDVLIDTVRGTTYYYHGPASFERIYRHTDDDWRRVENRWLDRGTARSTDEIHNRTAAIRERLETLGYVK